MANLLRISRTASRASVRVYTLHCRFSPFQTSSLPSPDRVLAVRGIFVVASLVANHLIDGDLALWGAQGAREPTQGCGFSVRVTTLKPDDGRPRNTCLISKLELRQAGPYPQLPKAS
jgi:hypothetical protein